jgi:hypothetical protein
MYKLSGAKSVKQYRGDENLPEAKKGMKNCGCKHPKAKYKYQAGVDDLDADIEKLYQEQQSSKFTTKKAPKVSRKVETKKPVTPKYTAPKNVETEADSIEKANTASRYKYLKNLEEMSRKQDSTYYANNIGRQIDEAVRNNTRVYVTENREGKPLKGKKSGDNTCITGVCNVAKKGGAKIPFNSAIAEDRNSPFDNPIQTRYNPAFRDNAANMGFKLLPQNAKLQKGDVVQLNEKGTPHHAMLYYDEGTAGSRFGNDVGNEDDGRSFFGLGPKKDLGFEKRWMGPFSNRTSSSINPIARNALAYRYMGVPNKKASMKEALAYGKSKKTEYIKKQELLARRNVPKEIPKNLIAMENIIPDPSELNFQKNGNKNIMSNKINKYKYKYGTGALAIPEGSAIVTANGGKNKQAIAAYKKGNYKLLNKIIDGMPEDKVSKKQAGTKEVSMFDLSNFTKPTPGFYRATRQGKGYGKYKAPDDETQKQREYEYEKDPKAFEKKYGKIATSLQKERMEAFKAGKEDFTWSDDNKLYKSGLKIPAREAPQNTNLLPNPNLPNGGLGLGKIENVDKKPDDKNLDNKRKGFDIPSLAEVAARSSILGQGIEGVPENYLKLGRYKYESQLPKTLQEIQLAEQAGRETSRDIVAGDAGRYLAQAGNLSAARMKAANDAVIQDTLARQDILNKNVDLGNTEAQVNTGLKNQFAALRAQSRANYNNQLVSLGQRIDSAVETGREMANQRYADDQRMQILRDLGLNYEYKNVDGLMKLVPKVPTNTPAAGTTTTTADATGKKGLKKLKTYKRN